MDYRLTELISEAEIAATVNRLAAEIDRDYEDRTPVVVGVLKGSFIFMADLVRAMKTSIHNIEFMRFSSYGSSTVSSGKAIATLGIQEVLIREQDVILVEDIVDTGITTSTALNELQKLQPASLKLCTLLDKPERRRVPVPIDYLGITIPDRFIVGYGTDFDQRYRQLPAIYMVDN